MREQAKKMNVASLRSGEQEGESAEWKLAKVKAFQFCSRIGGWGALAIFKNYHNTSNTGRYDNYIIVVYGMDTLFSYKLYGDFR